MHSSTSTSRRVLTFLSGACSLALALPALADSAPLDRSGVQGRLAAMAVPFVANDGQVDSRVAFYAPTFAGTVFVTRDGRIVYALLQGRKSPDGSVSSWSLTESFVAGSPQLRGTERGVTRVSSFVGDDPSAWKSDLPTYDVVRLGEVWDGVAVSLRAYGDNVEKLFTVQAGRSERTIRMRLTGALRLRTAGDGSLVAATGLGDVAFRAPLAYQERNGRRTSVPVAYVVAGNEYGFRLGAHDRSLPVVIDPILQSTYLGGSATDSAMEIAIHPTSGDVYVAGFTDSTNFPGTTGGAQPANAGGGNDAFIARLNSALTTLTQATYLGGTGFDQGLCIAIHPTSGDVYVGGVTTSATFPGTTGGAQPALGGGQDAFVARLNATLTTLSQATYLGGSGGILEQAWALAVHPISGEVYAAGETNSSSFPGTTGGAQPASGGGGDAFIARLNATLTTLAQSTYFGGTIGEVAFGLTIHPTSGEVFATGRTGSTDLPGTTGGAQPATGSSTDGFVARWNAALTALNQSTYLGGSAGEAATALTIHPTSSEVFVTGVTFSTNFPGTAGGAQPAIGGGGQDDAFISRLNATLTTLGQSTYLGVTGNDQGFAIAIHPTSGEVYVAGQTTSASFPGTAGGAQPALGGGFDAFISRLNTGLTTINQSTYLGGSGFEERIGMAFHPTSGELLVSGSTGSANFPVTTGGAQPASAGLLEGFVARLTADLAGGVPPTPGTPTNTATPTQTPTITQTPPLTPGGPTNTPTATLPPTSTPTLSPTIVGGGPGGPTAPIPTLAPWTMAILALALAGIGYLVLRGRS